MIAEENLHAAEINGKSCGTHQKSVDMNHMHEALYEFVVLHNPPFCWNNNNNNTFWTDIHEKGKH